MYSKKNNLYEKYLKRSLDLFLTVLGIIFLWPVFIVTAILIKIDSPGPIIFKQKRTGKDGKPFTIYKFRTMINKAEKLQGKYLSLNEADGPVFKIKNDPRFTPLGKKLAFSGLDELPQLFNVLKKDMSLVGPRPLPVNEAQKIPEKYKKARESELPGIVSPWVTNGRHKLSFTNWMNSDLDYVNQITFLQDLKIMVKTFKIIVNNLVKDTLP